jgi:hypothetical protein
MPEIFASNQQAGFSLFKDVVDALRNDGVNMLQTCKQAFPDTALVAGLTFNQCKYASNLQASFSLFKGLRS